MAKGNQDHSEDPKTSVFIPETRLDIRCQTILFEQFNISISRIQERETISESHRRIDHIYIYRCIYIYTDFFDFVYILVTIATLVERIRQKLEKYERQNTKTFRCKQDS